jgi:hypothetical protein
MNEWEDRQKKWNRLMKRARRTNRGRDASERKHGLATPGDCSVELHIRTVMQAVVAGFMSNDWSAVAEAQAMLEDVKKRVATDE